MRSGYSGYMRPSILWHLRATNGATVARVAALIGLPTESILRALRPMLKDRLVAPNPFTPGEYELTLKGLDAVRNVDVSQVECAPVSTSTPITKEGKP